MTVPGCDRRGAEHGVEVPLPNRAADPVHGAGVYQMNCAPCHQADGKGVRYSPLDAQVKGQRYQFPPLWGADSYNNAAGMARNITAAWFVRANMPRGNTFAYPQLDVGDAYDAVAYINEQPRPHKSGLEHDSRCMVEAGRRCLSTIAGSVSRGMARTWSVGADRGAAAAQHAAAAR